MDKIIKTLVERYKEKIKDKTFGEKEYNQIHIMKMLNELEENSNIWSDDKLNRWLGYIQGVLTVFNIIDVDEERDFSRSLFHNYYKKTNKVIPETKDLKSTP
jgi:hypothetical protein